MTILNQELTPPDAPVRVEVIAYITDGKQDGKATISFGYGEIPTKEEIKERLKQFEKEELKSMAGEKFRLMTAPEFFKAVMAERFGINEELATPTSFKKFADE